MEDKRGSAGAVGGDHSPQRRRPTIRRSRILDKLSKLENSKLALLTAPAGFGKTIVLAQLRQDLVAAGGTVISIALAGDDAVPGRAWTKLAHAFHSFGMSALDETSTPAADELRSELLSVVRAITNHINEVFLLIDNFDFAPTEFQEAIRSLIDITPQNFHMAIASRRRPAFSLGRLRSIGGLIELSKSCAFDLDETRALAHILCPADCSEERIRQIHDDCGGWPQCVSHLLAETRSKRSISQKVREDAAVSFKIADEALSSRGEHELALWSALSICERFSIDLACALVDIDRNDLAATLHNERLILSVSDNQEPSDWYRFRPVFVGVLRRHLSEAGLDAQNKLHERAAGWFARHGFVLEAIHHTRQSHSTTSLEALLDRLPIELRGLRLDAIHDLIADVDPATFKSLKSKVIGSWALIGGGSFKLGEMWAERVAFEDAGDDLEMAAHLHGLRATLAFLREDYELFFTCYNARPAAFSERGLLRYASTGEAMTILNSLGRFEESRNLLAGNIAAGEWSEDWALVLQTIHAVSFLDEGDVHEAIEQLRSIFQLAGRTYGDHSIAANVCAPALAEALYEIGDTGQVQQLVGGREQGVRKSATDPYVRFSIVTSRHIREKAGVREAASFLEAQIDYARHLPGLRARARLLAEMATLRLNWHTRPSAEPFIAELEQLRQPVDLGHADCSELAMLRHEVRGRHHLRSLQYDQAILSLEEARQFALRIRHGRSYVRLTLLAAVARYRNGEIDLADRLLTCGLETGQRWGLVRTIQDEQPEFGLALTARLPHLNLADETRAYVDRITSAGHDARPALRRKQEDIPQDIFTRRELEIIQLLAGSMTNKRIALALSISPTTVKWNLQNIYQKLGVASRYDVVVWSRKRLLH